MLQSQSSAVEARTCEEQAEGWHSSLNDCDISWRVQEPQFHIRGVGCQAQVSMHDPVIRVGEFGPFGRCPTSAAQRRRFCSGGCRASSAVALRNFEFWLGSAHAVAYQPSSSQAVKLSPDDRCQRSCRGRTGAHLHVVASPTTLAILAPAAGITKSLPTLPSLNHLRGSSLLSFRRLADLADWVLACRDRYPRSIAYHSPSLVGVGGTTC